MFPDLSQLTRISDPRFNIDLFTDNGLIRENVLLVSDE